MRKFLIVPLTLMIVIPLLAVSLYLLRMDAGVAEAKVVTTGDSPVNAMLLSRGKAFIDGAPTLSGATVISGSQVRSEADVVQVALAGRGRVELEANSEAKLDFDHQNLTVTILSGTVRVKSNSGVETNILTASGEVARMNNLQPAEAVITKTGNVAEVLPISGDVKIDNKISANRPEKLQLQVIEGDNQAAPIQNNYSENLRVKVTDKSGNPVSGVMVHFRAPAEGASLVFGNITSQATVVSNADGVAEAPAFRANGIGGDFGVTAMVPGGDPLAITLQNLQGLNSAAGPLRGAVSGASSRPRGGSSGNTTEPTITPIGGTPIGGGRGIIRKNNPTP
ncbi:MAG: hypothetical protein AB1489_02230 [Acidobacteriota bacterium]